MAALLFLELIQVALNNRKELSVVPSAKYWHVLSIPPI